MARDSRVWAPFANFHNPGRFGYDFSLGLRIRYVLWALLFYGLILLSPFRWKILGLLLIPHFLWANVFNRIRPMAAHTAVAAERAPHVTAPVIPTPPARLLTAPLK